MRKKTYLATACTLLLLAGGLYYFLKDEPLPPIRTEEAKPTPTANMTFVGTTIIEEKDGKPSLELSAEAVEVDAATKRVRLINIKGVLYRDDGSKINITGLQAEFDPQTKEVLMDGDVKAVAEDGAVFTAAQARWVGQARQLFGSGGVTLTRGDTTVSGNQIETDPGMEKVKVTGNARIIKGGTP